MSKFFQFVVRHKFQVLQAFLCIALLLLPALFWGDRKIVGGDDTRLYYFYPLEFLKNYATSIVGDNHISGLGYYFPLSQFWPTLIVIAGWNALFSFAQSQFLLFGAIIAIGYLGFYVFLGNWLSPAKPANRAARIVGGLMYSLSTFLYFTLFGAFWPGVFLIAVLPWVIHFLTQSIRGNKVAGTVASAVLLALFGNVIANLAWIAALLLVLLPFLIVLFVENKKKFVLRFALFFALYCTFSLLPLFHFVYAPLSADAGDLNPVARVSKNTQEDVRQNEQLIRSVAAGNSVLYPMFNLFHKGIQQNFKWASFENYKSWDLVLMPLNVLFLLVLLIGLLRVKRSDPRFIWLASGVTGWVGALFMFTANVTPYGLSLFILLNRHIPGFSMFRNMFDKFGLALAFIFAFAVALSLSVLIEKWRIKHRMLTLTVAVLVVLGAVPFISGVNIDQPFRSTASKYDTIHEFSDEYTSLLSYIDTVPGSGRFAWVPLAAGNYIPIQDSSKSDHYYVGPSPVKILTSKNDYTGGYSFFSDGDVLMKDLILQGRYEEAAAFLQKMNVEYLIVNNDVDAAWQKSYLYQANYPGDLFDAQGTKFKEVVLGRKLVSFGTHYDLYEINQAYKNSKISLFAPGNSSFTAAAPVTYTKLSSDHYTGVVTVTGEHDLTFLETYQKLWELKSADAEGKLVTLKATHSMVQGYANGWRINLAELPENIGTRNPDGSVTLNFTIQFKPAKYSAFLAAVSGAALVLALAYLVWAGLSYRRPRMEENG